MFIVQVSLDERTLMDEGKDQVGTKDWVTRKEPQGNCCSYWTLKLKAILKISFKWGFEKKVWFKIIATSVLVVNQGRWRVWIPESIPTPSDNFNNS